MTYHVGETRCASCGDTRPCIAIGDEGWEMCEPCLTEALHALDEKPAENDSRVPPDKGRE